MSETIMKMNLIAPILLSMWICEFAGVTEAKILFRAKEAEQSRFGTA
jgi:hypothetical protein